MKMNFILIAGLISTMLFSCGGSKSDTEGTENNIEESVDNATNEVVESIEEEVEEDPMKDKGVGPVTSVDFGDLDQAVADAGKITFDAKCSACHKMGKRFVGPDLTGVTARRTPEWIMNMILNPEQMVKENKIAKDLLMEYSAPMANQNLTEEEARGVLEYFRTVN